MAMKLRGLLAGLGLLLAALLPAGAQTQPNAANSLLLPCAASVPWIGGASGASNPGQCGTSALGTFAYQNFTAPPAIGGVTPAAGNFSTLGASGAVTFPGLTTAGSIGGTLCATTGGIVLYKVGVNCFSVGATDIAVGTTTVSSGTTGYLLYNNAGVLGNETIASVLTEGSGITFSGTTNVTIGLTTIAANRIFGNFTSGTAAPVANTMPSCADTGGNHLNYTLSGGTTAFSCGTSVASIAANSVLANFTAGSAAPVANTVTSCTDTAGNHLNYTNASGFSCGTSIPTLAANSVLANFTASTATPIANTVPSCIDTTGNHLNYTNATGFTCGTSIPNISGFLTAGSGIGLSGTSNVTVALASIALNSVVANFTSGSAVPIANTVPSCTDSGGNHLNYTNASGFSCGTSILTSTGAWTPTANTFAPSASPTYTGFYSKVGRHVYVQVATGGTGTIAPSAGSNFTGLPFASTQGTGCNGIQNGASGATAANGGYINASTWFVPTLSATNANTPLYFSCWYDTSS